MKRPAVQAAVIGLVAVSLGGIVHAGSGSPTHPVFDPWSYEVRPSDTSFAVVARSVIADVSCPSADSTAVTAFSTALKNANGAAILRAGQILFYDSADVPCSGTPTRPAFDPWSYEVRATDTSFAIVAGSIVADAGCAPADIAGVTAFAAQLKTANGAAVLRAGQILSYDPADLACAQPVPASAGPAGLRSPLDESGTVNARGSLNHRAEKVTVP